MIDYLRLVKELIKGGKSPNEAVRDVASAYGIDAKWLLSLLMKPKNVNA